jgi:chaperone modulatory protein CbpM
MARDIHHAELVDEAGFTAEDLARACRVQVSWVRERVEVGVLQVHAAGEEWRFTSATLVRARRIAGLETSFGADPQLAALTVDLMEEVIVLRRRVSGS